MTFPMAMTVEEGNTFHERHRIHSPQYFSKMQCIVEQKRARGNGRGQKMGDEGLLRAGIVLSSGGSTPRMKLSCRALPLQGCVGFELLSSASSLR